MTTEQYNYSGKIDWGSFDISTKSKTDKLKFTWDPAKTIINKVQMIIKLDWSYGDICAGQWAHVYFNNTKVMDYGWYLGCEHAESNPVVTSLLQNGDNYVTVEAFNYSLVSGNSLLYNITIIFDYTGEEPKVELPFDWTPIIVGVAVAGVVGVAGYYAYKHKHEIAERIKRIF